jgi:hypothetical protein
VGDGNQTKPGKRRAEKQSRGGGFSLPVARVRSILATAVWLAAVLCALSLAVGALLVALQMNRDNAIVDVVLNVANTIDFGVFKDFEPDPPDDPTRAEVRDARQSAETKSVMVNWGLAALIYLVVGKVLDRVIRPRA